MALPIADEAEMDAKASSRSQSVCAACGKVTLARACSPPRQIESLERNPVVKCQHCDDIRQYLTKDCFLAPVSAAVSPDRSSGTLAVVAGLIAAVKLARVESDELGRKSLRVRSAIADSITIARMVIEASKGKA
jgi:DNA-directed RNA polymerase subunit RPC12/RpoP